MQTCYMRFRRLKISRMMYWGNSNGDTNTTRYGNPFVAWIDRYPSGSVFGRGLSVVYRLLDLPVEFSGLSNQCYTPIELLEGGV